MRSSVLADPPKNFNVDTSLSNELLKLNFNDRANIEEELHGVRCGAAAETPKLLEKSLAEFDEGINAKKEQGAGNGLLKSVVSISLLEKAEAEKAKSKCYLNDPDVRLRFLRCEQFAVDKAIERLITFLEFTAELFGDFVADRPICLSDFSPREETALQNSRVQYLPFRDRSGRRVCASVGSSNFDLDADLRFKILMYLHWVVSEDIETQRKGIVLIAWIFDEDENKSWQHKLRPQMKASIKPFHLKHWESLPVRLASYQQYYVQDTTFFRMMCSLYVFHIKPNHRKLYRSYFGEQTELLYKLSSFGVPTDLLPVSCTGKVKTANQSAWINVQRAKLFNEKNNTTDGEEIVECPRSEDVVFKKGPGYRNNPGNMYFRCLIEQEGENHQNAEKEEKYQITLRIVSKIEEINGRFLEWSKPEKMWLVNKDRSKIRSKVASSIKQYNRQRAQQSQQLKTSIQNATSVAKNDRNDRDGVTSSTTSSAVPRRLSTKFVPHAKRRRIVNICDTLTPGDDTDEFCFGRSFFLTPK